MIDELPNSINPEERLELPSGTALQQVSLVAGKWAPVSRKLFLVRCKSRPRVLGELRTRDRRGNTVAYPVVTLPGFGRGDAKFAVLTASKFLTDSQNES